jgi:hypothetical protein
MVAHKFRVGERVRFQATGLTSSQTGIYEVTALMPQERGAGFQYRLKSKVDGHQRVALEDSLSRTQA